VIRYGSSFRAAAVAETLARARALAGPLGISRVTEVTAMDRLGVPVYVAIRPDASPGTVCVTAGKGLTRAEACVGAYMEAIELAWADGRTQVPLVAATARALGEREDAVLDFCPIWGTTLDLDAPLLCVAASDVVTGASALVPAESVLHPLGPQHRTPRWFGTGSNGLASGNSVDEATVHGLAEVIERDVTSFHAIRDRSRLVRPETLPAHVRALRETMGRLGFELLVRWLPNPFGLPSIMAVGFDRQQPDVTLRGDGCHPARDVALNRAVTETVQCRLSLIHGGRDDMTQVTRPASGLTGEQRAEVMARLLAELARADDAVSWDDVPDRSAGLDEVADCLRFLVEVLAAAGLRRVLRVVLTPPDYPVAVVRVIVPGLEHYTRPIPRIGPRLRRLTREA
jgi:ribosomal protein S12 methylthiotransferase accessory factor